MSVSIRTREIALPADIPLACADPTSRLSTVAEKLNEHLQSNQCGERKAGTAWLHRDRPSLQARRARLW